MLHLDAGNSSSYSGSGNTWNDLSSSGNNGTINGATFNSTNKSFDFDGTNDYVGLSAVLSQGQAEYTIEGYFKPDTQQTDVIFEQVQAGGGQHTRAAMMTIGDGYGGFNGWSNDFHDNTPVRISDWNYWTITVEKNLGSNQVKVYVNGILQSQGNTNNGANNLNVGTGSTNIGSRLSGVGEFFDGEIKTIKVYNRVLSAAEVKQNYWATVNPYVVTEGLVLLLDSNNLNSYDGNGSSWRNLSGHSYDFSINPNAHRTINGVKHMDFEGSYGAAQYIINNSRSDVPSYSNATMQVFTSIKNTTSDHRTLVRGSSNDHPVIIQNGNNNLGMHDNDNVGFIDTGFDITSLPNPYTQFNFLDFKLAQSSPYMKFKFNTDSNIYQITNANATFHRGFHAIGKWFHNQNNVNTGSQWWGKIGVFLYYNRELSAAETTQNYNAFATRHSLPYHSSLDINLSSNSIAENSSNSSQVGTLSATGTSVGSVTFSFANSNDARDDDNGSFTINGTSLIINSSPDYETKASYNIYINVNDGANNYAKAFTVSVTNINEAPTDLGFATSSLSENGLLIYLDSRNPNSYSGSGSTWSDLSGNQNHFTVKGGMTYNSTNGFRFEANNTTKYAYKTSFNHPSTTYTDEFLLKTSTNNYGAFKFYGVSGNDNLSLLFHTNNIKLYANGQAVHIGVNINDGNWHHFVRTSNRSTGQEKVYLDGILAFTGNISNGSTIPQGGSLILGNESDATFNPTNNNGLAANNAFDGFIPIYRLYNKVLTAQEVSSNFSAMISNGNPTAVNSSGSSSSTASFDEGSAVGTVVATLTATDSDTTNLTYSLATGNGTTDQHNSLFTVSGTQLLVASSTISYDTTTSLNVNLKVSDGQNTLTKAFQIAVNDLNRAPTDIGLTSNTITENASPSTVIGTLSSVDLDTTDTSTFTLATSGDAQDDDNGSFTISGTSLILNSSPDYETKSSYNIYINVNDGANNYAKAFTVSVTNINEAPTDLGFAISSLSENGLVLYLDSRNSNSYSGSGNTWSDLSGNGNDFTMVGNFSHSTSNGFDFDTGQSTKYFKDNSFAHPTTTFTDEFLIKTSRSTNNTWKSYNVSGNDNQSLMMQLSNADNLYLGLPGGDFYSNVSGISDGAWHHLVRTSNRTSGAEKIYLDGQLVYNQTVQAGSLITTNGHYFIGQEQDSPGGGLDAGQAFDGFCLL